jgi:hypothetical protein
MAVDWEKACSDMAGLNLGEKKEVKENQKHLEAAQKRIAAVLPECKLLVNLPSFSAKISADNKKWLGHFVFEKHCGSIAKCIETLCEKGEEVKKSLQKTVKKILFDAECKDGVKHTQEYSAEDKSIRIHYNIKDYASYSFNDDQFCSEILNQLPAITEGENKLDLDFTGVSATQLANMNSKMDAFAAERAKMQKLGFVYKVDLPSWYQGCSDDDGRKYLAGWLFEKFVPEWVTVIQKFCDNADYKEALNEKVKTVVLKGCRDKQMPDGKTDHKHHFEIKGDQLIITQNGFYYSYGINSDELVSFLEKSL